MPRSRQKQNLASRQQHDIRSGGRTGEIDPLGRCGASWLMHTAVRHAPKMPFTDLHSFKDFVTYVQTYLPDRFPPREAVGPEDQWTLDLAFFGLRQGLEHGITERGSSPELTECSFFVDEAEKAYRAGDWRAGFTHLENVRKLLRRIRTE